MQLSAEQLAATTIADNLVVNAGAGSGKTTVLTHRYVRLLEEGGLSPGEIVAITFTSKAAREMRERIDQLLRERATGDSQWKQVRDELVQAPIGTIHSFYARILRSFPVEAGIDPGFRVLEEMEASMLLNDALAATFQGAVRGEDPNLKVLAVVLGADALEEEGGLAQQLRSTYQALMNRGIPLEEARLTDKYKSIPEWRQCRDRFLEIVGGEAELAVALADKDQPEMARKRMGLVAAGRVLAEVQAPRELLALYQELFPLTQLKGGRTKGQKEFVNGAVGQLRLLLTGALAPLLGEATLSLLMNLDREYRRRKARVGGLDFSDLQLAVWRLLQANPWVIEKLRLRYRTYMIDEFQDTDRLQYRIITALVEEGGEIPPGRLFLVGDEKQSIYRFRGAEVRVFDQARQQLTRDNPQREKRITCNYRSRKSLIALVNGLFSQLMDKGQGSEIEYISLAAHRQESGPCAELLTCTPDGAESVAEAEARILASRIREMVAGKELTIEERSGTRTLRYGDIAILLRARTHLKEYEHNLRLKGIPYTVVGGIGFYQQQEVQDIVNLLRVVDNLRDELSLAAVLRSPLFALDDDSLLALAMARQQGGSLLDRGDVLAAEPRRRLERAAEIISSLRQCRGRLEVPRLVERAMDLTLAREVNLTRFAGLQHFANLQKLLDLAEKYSAAGNDNLTGFLRWVEYTSELSEAEAQVDSEDSNSVKILTIHASKGLEFPVVFLPACSTALRPRYGRMLVDEAGGLAFKYPWDCAVWEEVQAWEGRRQEEEHKRLLYVAVTRARDYLAVLVRDKEGNEPSFNCWLRQFAASSPQHFLQSRPGDGGLDIQLPAPLPEPQGGQDIEIEEFFPGLTPLGKGRRAIRYYSISQFCLWRSDRELFERRYLSRGLPGEIGPVQEQGDWSHEHGGASFGSLLHSALEVIQPGTDISSLLRELAPKFFPEADAEQGERVFFSAKALLESYQKDPGLPGDFSQSFTEHEFYYRLGNALFYGLIDRVLIAQDHVVILDYKSNRIPPAGIQPLLDLYAPQLQFYALAAGEIYKKPVRAFLQLLRLPPGRQLVEISLAPGELQALQAQLQEFIDCCQG